MNKDIKSIITTIRCMDSRDIQTIIDELQKPNPNSSYKWVPEVGDEYWYVNRYFVRRR